MLKHEPKAELQLPVLVDLYGLVAVRRRNLAESSIAVVDIRPIEMRGVRSIERFGAEFQAPPLRDPNFSEKRRVDFKQSGTVQHVSADVAKGVGQRSRKRRGVEIAFPRTNLAEDPHRASYVGPIDVARSIEACITDGDVERQPAIPRPEGVDLSSTEHSGPRTSTGPGLSRFERKLIDVGLGEDMPPVPIGEASIGGEVDVIKIAAGGAGIKINGLSKGVGRREHKAV